MGLPGSVASVLPQWFVPHPVDICDLASPYLQVVTVKARVVSNTLLSTIYATITNTTSSMSTTPTTSTTSSTTSLTVAGGCVRESKGALQVSFYVSAENVTREIYGLPGARRRLQSTPCSATDGTLVGR